jgi:hypothetical protein
MPIMRARFAIPAFTTMAFLMCLWLLLEPANPVTSIFRAQISATESSLITGPYPTSDDFRELDKRGVTAIVTLLDPTIPYERILLDKEAENAHHHGIALFDFPMASLFGQPLGGYYETDARFAARTIEMLRGHTVYLHCYLGKHRLNHVRDILAQHGTMPGAYADLER